MTTKPKKTFDLSWGDAAASGAAAASLTKTAERVDIERQALTEKAVTDRIEAAVAAARPGLDKVPDPVEPTGDGDLTDDEQVRYDACRAGVELLTTAHWVAGKSLDTIATGRLFRRTPHRLEPDRCYQTIEEWAWVEHGIRQAKCSKLRAAWQLGEVLAARGYDAPEGTLRPLVPVQARHGLMAAVSLYEIAVQTWGADRVTADHLRELVQLLPGDLALTDPDNPEVVAGELREAIEGADPSERDGTSAAVPAALKRDATRRAVGLADQLGRGRIPHNELLVHLLTAFTDQQDTRVYDAVADRMKRTTQ